MNIRCRHGRTFKADPERTALIVIDMQRDFLDAEGASGLAGVDTGRLAAIVPAVRGVLDAARAAGLVVIHTREGHRPDLSDLPRTKQEQYAASGIPIGEPGPLGRRFVRGEPGHDIVAALAPMADETVIDKPGFGAFFGTDLEERLRTAGVTHIILSGVTTQCCVHSTLREAVDRGFACLTVADACATEDPALHEAVLRIIASEGHLFGWIADSVDVTASLAAASR
jgi:nicotinamidase-related amidase